MATRVIQLLPCLCCRHGEQAVEEIAAVYLSARGEGGTGLTVAARVPSVFCLGSF